MTWEEWRPPSVETDTVKVGTAISRIAKSLGVGDLDAFSELTARWNDIAGEDFAPHIQPAHLERDVLLVQISEHSWRATLKWIAPKLVETINKEIPAIGVKEIRYLKET